MRHHTPGPWKHIVHEGIGGQDYIQILSGSWDIAHNRHSARDWEEEKANARLIAAAPELLEACKWSLDILDRHAGCGHVSAIVRKAIVKAEVE